MKLWGKTRDELDAERHEALARREHLAKRDLAARQEQERSKHPVAHDPNVIKAYVAQVQRELAAPTTWDPEYGPFPSLTTYEGEVAMSGEDAARCTTASELGAFYAQRVNVGEPRREYFFGEDFERFDSLGRECQAMDQDETTDEPRWIAAIALVLVFVALVGAALALS